MPDLQQVVVRLERFPELAQSITLTQLEAFLRLVSRLLPTIRSSEANEDISVASQLTLPPSVLGFLAATLQLPESIVILCWAGFGDLAGEPTTLINDDEALGSLGPQFGVAGDTLEPPTHCTTDICRGALLTKRRDYPATFFTLRRGVLPITIVSLYCQHCQTTYHHNYKVRHASEPYAQREYYGGVPDRIMVSMHHVVERELVVLWESQMVFSHTSAEAASRIYNAALRTRTTESDQLLLPTTVWDGFFLHALLRDVTKRGFLLSVPHNGSNVDRLNIALETRNTWMVGTGQDQWAHACKGCMKVIGDRRLHACVADGVTVGHACCGVLDCQIALSSQRAWFCPAHSNLQFICAVIRCDHRAGIGWRTCSDPEHRAYEENRRTKGKAMFLLRARQARDNGQTEPQVPASDIGYLDEGPPEVEDTPAAKQVKIRGRLSRRWTHNEQLMVRCCGVILSRATFFGSEAITSVKDFIHVTFPLHYPGSLPSFIFFDNDCLLLRHLMASSEPRDARLVAVGFPVDVFHASRKHKDSDEFCVMNCSPVTFAQLMDGDTWIFNSSAAEQVNRWFGRFQAIVKEMPVLRYNFFLDEMIGLRNTWMVEKLQMEGKRPHFIPLDDLENRM